MARSRSREVPETTAPADADDAAAYIASNLPLQTVPGLPGLVLHQAGPNSGLGRYTAAHNAGRPPYWAYPWSGGLALARHLNGHPELVRERRVLDLGAGGGVVAIAAARLGAATVLAAEIDPLGATALRLNAAANGVAVTIVADDLLDGPPPDADVVLVGDLFYAADLAARVGAFLDRCVPRLVLVGDPDRDALPRQRLQPLATYDLDTAGFAETQATVYTFEPAAGA